MLELDTRFSNYVLSHCKVASRVYDFILKNVPDEPWILRIKAVKGKGDKRYKGICNLMVRRVNDKDFFHPSMKSENPEEAIYLTLTMFLLGEIKELAKDKTFK